NLGAAFPGNPPALNGELYFEFLDPNTLKVVPEGNPNGKIVRLSSSYSVVPAFGQYVGLSKQVITAGSNGAVPQLDAVICFDISGSIDDQTPVTVVRRIWDPITQQIKYQSPTTPSAPGNIYDLVAAPPTGTGLNGCPLQGLLSADTNHSGLVFSEYYAKTHGAKGLRSNSVVPEAGQAPGNFYGAPTFPNQTGLFTDLVVNINGLPTYSATTSNGYDFPDINTLVEASRGNLETVALMTSSKADTSVNVQPKVGYQKEYFSAALKHLQPIQDAKDATTTFCQILNNDTDAHFGLVAFDDKVGVNPSTTDSHYDIDDSTPYGTKKPFPAPLVPLDKTVGNSQYQACLDALPNLVAKGNTNIGLAIDTAVNQLKTNSRPNSVKAVILFTDGQPTSGGSDPFAYARLAATHARDAGIPVYCIGLATNPTIAINETAILNDTDPNPTSGGIAAISGQGALYYQVTNSSQLRATFEKIARHLVQLVQDQ
ncbi:MAG: VWA domain-containing protein, partial [Candidatus Obscuribacterales bacterium]|nr:VWA domain-containing protein [Candidatus Obscuribacterales bacterium]